MSAAQAKIHEQFARRGEYQASRLGGDQSLEMDQIDKPGFNQLRLWQGRHDTQHRFIGEEHRPFRHRLDIAGKLERCQVIDESRFESSAALDPIEFLGCKTEPLEKRERLLETCNQQEITAVGKLAHEQFKYRRCLHTT